MLLALILAAAAPVEGPSLEEVPSEDAGHIIVYRRGSVWGAAIGCPIRFEGEDVTELGRGRFAELDVEPGRYILENRHTSVEVLVEPGETRYVRCQIKRGFLSGRAELQVVSGAEFDDRRSDFELADNR